LTAGTAPGEWPGDAAAPEAACSAPSAGEAPSAGPPCDRGRLTYAGGFPDPLRAGVVHGLEWATGKPRLLRLIRRFEASGVPSGQAFWARALRIMRIEVTTPPEEIRRIPASGPLVIVANHPHGLVDGVVLADLVGRVRTDYRILARPLPTDIPEIAPFMIPVPFPHEPDARRRSLEMRRRALAHLQEGGAVILFPAGGVAAANRPFGPAVEQEWHPFTARLIQRSGAAVVPIRFFGQTSRLFRVAGSLSPTLRQGLFLHEVVRALNRPQAPAIGFPLARADIAARCGDARRFASWLRDQTLGLER
jgi:putative hemolysin